MMVRYEYNLNCASGARRATMMRNWLILLTLLAFGTAVDAQTATFGRIPERPELDRVGMRLGWSIMLPLEGPRDAIVTLQLLVVPDPVRREAETTVLVAQTRSGTIAVYDGETGRRIWSRRPAPIYPAFIPEVGYDQ